MRIKVTSDLYKLLLIILELFFLNGGCQSRLQLPAALQFLEKLSGAWCLLCLITGLLTDSCADKGEK